MKLSVFMVFIFYSTLIHSQENNNSKVSNEIKIKINTLTQNYFCEDVLHVDSVNQKDLYEYARIWLTNMDYKTCRNKKVMPDNEHNRIIAEQYFNLKSYSYRLHCTLALEFKDSRFKFSYGNFDFGSTGLSFQEIVTQNKYSDIKPEVEKIISNLMSLLQAQLIQNSLKGKW